MITNNDPARESLPPFPLPSPETIAGFDDEQLPHARSRSRIEGIKSYQRFSSARLTAVLTGAVGVLAVCAVLGVFPGIAGNLTLGVATVFVVLVFAAAVMMAIVQRNDMKAWQGAEGRISTELERRQGDAR